MIPITPELVIEAFDDVVDYIYGRRWGRDYKHKTDIEVATRWIAEGLTLPIAIMVFQARLHQMHERWLKQIDPHARENIPTAIKIFDENILSGIRRFKAGGDELPFHEQKESLDRAKVTNWLKGLAWYENLWGAPPYHSDCRISRKVLAELLPKEQPKKCGPILTVG